MLSNNVVFYQADILAVRQRCEREILYLKAVSQRPLCLTLRNKMIVLLVFMLSDNVVFYQTEI